MKILTKILFIFYCDLVVSTVNMLSFDLNLTLNLNNNVEYIVVLRHTQLFITFFLEQKFASHFHRKLIIKNNQNWKHRYLNYSWFDGPCNHYWNYDSPFRVYIYLRFFFNFVLTIGLFLKIDDMSETTRHSYIFRFNEHCRLILFNTQVKELSRFTTKSDFLIPLSLQSNYELCWIK